MLDHKSALIIATLHQQLYMLKLAVIYCGVFSIAAATKEGITQKQSCEHLYDLM